MPRIRESQLGATFDRLWTASLASNFADGLIGTAAPLLALTFTREPLLIAMFGIIGSLPWLLFAIPIGGLADRVDRGIGLAVANAVRLGLILLTVLAIALDRLNLPLLFAIVFLSGICEVFVDTTTQAVVPTVLEPSQFEAGNARMNLAESVVQTFVGAPLGAFLFATAAALPFALGSSGYLVAAILILAVAGDRALRVNRGAERPHFVADLKDGIAFLARHRQVRYIVLFTTSVYAMFSVAHATVTLFIIDELGVPTAWFGTVLTVGGIGYIGGTVVATRVSRRLGRGRAMAICMALGGLLVACEGLAPNVWVFGLATAAGNFLMAIWNVLLMACYQVLIPAELFGRVHGARRTVIWGLGPIGAVAGGSLATVLGLRIPMVIGGLGVLAITLLGARRIVQMGDATAS